MIASATESYADVFIWFDFTGMSTTRLAYECKSCAISVFATNQGCCSLSVCNYHAIDLSTCLSTVVVFMA